MARGPSLDKIDLDKLKHLMRLKPTLADTAAFFECSERSIERLIRDNWDLSFVEFREQNMVHTRLSLIRKAIQMAESGNVPMMIFCLKNVCGWSDRFDAIEASPKTIVLKYNVDEDKETDANEPDKE